MGSIISSNEKAGSIEFELPEINYYTSGQTIHGFLNLNLKNNFQGHILELKITREETSKFRREKNIFGQRIIVTERGKEKMLDFTMIVRDFKQGSCNESFNMPILTDFKVPFQLTLGPNFPSSLEFENLDKISKGSLKYTLYAYLIPTNPSIKPIITSKNINIVFAQSQTIIEQQPAPQLQELPLKSSHVIFCFCFDKEFKLSYAPNKLTYYPGENMLVTIKGNLTQFSYTITSYKVVFIQVVELFSLDRKKYDYIWNIISEEKTESTGKELNTIVRIPIPSSIKPSTFGEIIKMYYTIRIEPYIQECCISVMPSNNCYPNQIRIVVPPNISQDISDNI